MTYPSWWGDDVRVVGRDGSRGTIGRAGKDSWLVHLDGLGEDGESNYVAAPDPNMWEPEVRQILSPGQRDRIVHDAQVALLRAFGCHYVPYFEALPERVRVGGTATPRALGRPELDGLQVIIRGAVTAALSAYTSGI